MDNKTNKQTSKLYINKKNYQDDYLQVSGSSCNVLQGEMPLPTFMIFWMIS